MSLDVSVLPTDVPNSEILDAIRNESSSDYQNRIPSADKAGVAQTIQNLMDPANRRWKNEFIDALVNRIGLTIARSNSWTNPLATFKRGMLEYGNTIEEIQVGLLKAHNYDADRDYMEGTLFGRERPEVQTNFHTVNRQDFYKVTVNEAMLNRAFLDPNGLSGFVNMLMEAPSNSDSWDEFLLTTSLFAEYESNGGFYHANIPDVAANGSTESQAKTALRKMRSMADTLKFLSTKYNAARMPSFASADDLILLTSPEFNAAIDVEALAGAFNVDKATMHGRVIPIPKENFGIDGCQAIMTTKDFFVIADKLFESTSQWNPASLSNNYFLHHHEVVSASRFVPAVMFTTGADDEVITVHTAPTSIGTVEILPGADGTVPTTVAHGGLIAFAADVVPADADQAVQWTIAAADGADRDLEGDEPTGVVVESVIYPLSSGTFITQSGVVHIGLDERNDAVAVTATTVVIDPSDGIAYDLSESLTVLISDVPLTQWPAL
jgi:hypothetical protein